MSKERSVGAMAGWFGGARMISSQVGESLRGCSFVCVPFAGSMPEIRYITAPSVLCVDRHRHIINLARVAADDELRPQLIKRLWRKAPIHADELREAQSRCVAFELRNEWRDPDLNAAENYFVACWMARASKAGTLDEFKTGPCIRYGAGGGDSAVRYFGALRALVPFSQILRRCSFSVEDAFDVFPKLHDKPNHAIYADSPWPEAGRVYKHNAGKTAEEERAWHTQLRNAMLRFEKSRIVMRFHRHPLVSELYPDDLWEYRGVKGRSQANDEADEVLLVRRR